MRQWQAYIDPTPSLPGVGKIAGKIYRKEKDARREARRIIRTFVEQHNLTLTNYATDLIIEMPARYPIQLQGAGYGDIYAIAGIRPIWTERNP